MITPGRLQARPQDGPKVPPPIAGLHALALRADRDALIHVPEVLAPGPVPLVVMLHGAGCDVSNTLPFLQAQAERHGCLVLLPHAEARTWDLIASQYGPDVEQLDIALERVFGRFDVDPLRLAIAGFSDGASYALSLGLLNGDLFGHILAFSPGFVAPGQSAGQPSIFISHGIHDRVLPVRVCGRYVSQALAREGFPVDYHEFDGGHEVPPAIADLALARWLG